MPAYVLPQVRVFQDRRRVPAAAVNPLLAHISGPHAQLVRYAETDEQVLGRLGFYDRLLATPYTWPNRAAGATVDQSYTKLFVKNGILKYFEDDIGQGSVITKAAGYNNRIAAAFNFATNSFGNRDTRLLDRDVRVGDIVKVRGITSGSVPITLWSYVKGLLGQAVAATVAAAVADTANAASQSASTTVAKIGGVHNCATMSANASLYEGRPSGYINETYDILVTEGSVGGDYTIARLRVLSGSGLDDVASVTPAANGNPTTIGARGLKVTFTDLDTTACSASAAGDGVSADDLIAGQRWQVVVHQVFSPAAATSGGTYTGTEDTTYVVEVSRGGAYSGATKPQIMVSTINGTDLSGPTLVAAAASPVTVGSYGATIRFSGSGLRKGDRYYIAVTAAGQGALNAIEIGHNLDTAIPGGSQVDLSLFILRPTLSITRERFGFAPILNWETSTTEITVADGITVYDDTWTSAGVPQALNLYSESTQNYGELFVEYRAWRSELIGQVGGITDPADLDTAITGPLHPDNPLKWGVFKALENANGAVVHFTAVQDPDDDDSWVAVLEKILGRDDVYVLAPLTRRPTVHALFAAHVDAQSSPEQGNWRETILNLAGVPEIPIVAAGSTVPGHVEPTTTDSGTALAIIEDDPTTSGTQYTRLRCTSNNAPFVTLGARPGDVVRILYTSDGFGHMAYSSFVVDAVETEGQLRLVSGPNAPITVAVKFELWRNLSADDEAAEIGNNAGSFGSRRVSCVWPDQIESSGTVQEGYFLAASIAGLISGVLPQQGLTHLEIAGYTDVPRTTLKFNRTQLDRMAVSGVWIVTQDPNSGRIFSRHAVTTADYNDIDAREEAQNRKIDAISYRYKNQLAPYIGVVNVVPAVEERIRADIEQLNRDMMVEGATPELGGLMVSAEITSFRRHLTFRDRYVVTIAVVQSYPLNNVDVHIVL